MFWGCVIANKKSFEIKSAENQVIHLSEACLNRNAGSNKVYLVLSNGEEKYNICVLQKDKWESYRLDHYISLAGDSNKKYKLSIEGGDQQTEVHVTGYVEKEELEEKEEVVLRKDSDNKKRDEHGDELDLDEEEELDSEEEEEEEEDIDEEEIQKFINKKQVEIKSSKNDNKEVKKVETNSNKEKNDVNNKIGGNNNWKNNNQSNKNQHQNNNKHNNNWKKA